MKVMVHGHYSKLEIVYGILTAIGERKIDDKEARRIYEEYAAELLGEEPFHISTECACSHMKLDDKYMSECKCFAHVDVASTGAPPSKEYEI